MQFLSKLIKGIFGFFTGLLKPKKDGFFLEYEGQEAPATEQQEAAATPAAESAEPAQAVAVAPEAPAAKTKTFRGAKKSEAAAPAAPPAPVAPAPVAAALNLPAPKVIFADIAMNPASGSAKSRRRPGANMASFLDMARQVSTSR